MNNKEANDIYELLYQMMVEYNEDATRNDLNRWLNFKRSRLTGGKDKQTVEDIIRLRGEAE